MGNLYLLLPFLVIGCLLSGCCEDFCPCPPAGDCSNCPIPPCPTLNCDQCPKTNDCISPTNTIIIEAPASTYQHNVVAFLNPDNIARINWNGVGGSGYWKWNNASSGIARAVLYVDNGGSSPEYIELYQNHEASVTFDRYVSKGTWHV